MVIHLHRPPPEQSEMNRVEKGFVLPGNYAFYERYEERVVLVTFQTYEEMLAYMEQQEIVSHATTS